MIHGPGVQMKYGAIVEGVKAEIFAGIPASQREQKNQEFVAFLDKIRNGTLEEFEEWYQLYK
jgi:hypothetical protein